jgi:hypothetical protein
MLDTLITDVTYCCRAPRSPYPLVCRRKAALFISSNGVFNIRSNQPLACLPPVRDCSFPVVLANLVIVNLAS